jgi:hypothetical protein
MAANQKPIFEYKPLIDAPLQFATTDTTTKKTLIAGAADSSRIDAIHCCSNDTAAISLNFYINNSVTDFYIGTVAIPIGAGYTTVAKVDAITILAPVLGYLWIPTGWSLKCACNATMATAGRVLDVVPQGGVYS